MVTINYTIKFNDQEIKGSFDEFANNFEKMNSQEIKLAILLNALDIDYTVETWDY